jgi:SAM-dependent methyltransferase
MQHRDTDNDWEAMARSGAYYAVLTDPKFLDQNLNPAAKAEFFQGGRDHAASILATIRSHFDPAFHPDTTVDFGCGVGRLLLGLARHSRKAIGLDVSSTMLSIARQNADEQDIPNIELLLSDDQLSELEPGYDLLNSVIVFQHIPPPRGHLLLNHLLKGLRGGGFFHVHITFAKDRGFVENSLRHVKTYCSRNDSIEFLEETDAEGVIMSMYDYDLNRVFLSLLRAGVQETLVQFVDHGGCLGLGIYGRKK